MYCALDSNGKNIVAIHDNIEVVKRYCEMIKKFHDVYLPIGKIKKKKIKDSRMYEDLYLVRYNDTYVQAGYVDVLKLMSDDFIYDYKYTTDILMRILEVSGNEISNGEKKAVRKVILMLDRLIKEDEEFVPQLNTLQSARYDLECYEYNKGIPF